MITLDGEYKHFIKEYLLPILGVPKNNNNIEPCNFAPSCELPIVYSDNALYFNAYQKPYYCLRDVGWIDWRDLRLGIEIVFVFLRKCSAFFLQRTGRRVDYSDIQREINYRYAVQRGLLQRLVRESGMRSDTKSVEAIEKLFDILEDWSVKTYEGRPVTFGFIIDFETEVYGSAPYGSFLDFLKDDLSAVLTDCIHSVIILDRNCNFMEYSSLTKSDSYKGYELNSMLPYRFTGTIKECVHGNRIGIFLLANGDIIISKDEAIRFVKRNRKWLNFSFNAFCNAVSKKQIPIEKWLLECVYATMLDISFTHTGGILAIVEDLDSLLKKPSENEQPILRQSDYLLSYLSDEDLKKEMKTYDRDINDYDMNRRLLKRQEIKTLVNGKNFSRLDRKLRCELASLDGACIINRFGQVCAFGAIIRNDSGSSGGGRTSAAKRLSYNEGVAIKISTDGYIEMYINNSMVYSIK